MARPVAIRDGPRGFCAKYVLRSGYRFKSVVSFKYVKSFLYTAAEKAVQGDLINGDEAGLGFRVELEYFRSLVQTNNYKIHQQFLTW